MNADEMMQFVTPDLDPRKNADHLFLYRGINCRQTRRVFASLDALTQALVDNPPQTIIEIGTFHGAFTRLLRDHDISEGTEIHTFDITNFSKPRVEEVTYHFGNVFGDKQNTVKEIIAKPGRCLVFCDGGNKELEVKTFCRMLKRGDIILCHDYIASHDVLKEEIIGNWPVNQYEAQWSNIEQDLTSNGCVPFMAEEMQRAMWGCFIRQG